MWIGAFGRLSRQPVVYSVSSLYVSLVRGTPLLVQLYFIYYALPEVGLVAILALALVCDPEVLVGHVADAAPERRGAAVAQSGTLAARHHRRQPAAFAIHDGVADGVDTAVDGMEPAAAHPPGNGGAGEPRSHELRGADHAALTTGDGRNPRVNGLLGEFVSHSDTNVPND